MKTEHCGVVFGALAAICYGTNPLGALHLYAVGLTPSSVLFYRFLGAALLTFLTLLALRKSLRFPKENLPYVAALGLLFALSALSLFSSFLYMDAGIASTMLFDYPILVAVIMMLFFKEKLNRYTAFAILFSLLGVALLTHGENGILSPKGILLVFISSLSYAIYIIVAAHVPKPTGALKFNLYVLLFCAFFILLFTILVPGHSLQKLPDWSSVGWVINLALVPTLLSLVFMVKALKIIGSTPTAILGALEPLTAVCIGVFVFNEAFTWRLLAGIVLIFSSVTLIALKKR